MPQILVVDDNAVNRKLIRNILEKAGKDYECVEADSGRAALDLAETSRPDLVLMDIMMPEMDGFEACRAFKANPIFRFLPILFVTAMEGAEDLVKGFQAGGVDYVRKPISADELKARVAAHLEVAMERSKNLTEIINLEMVKGRDEIQILKEMVATYNHNMNQPLMVAFMALDGLQGRLTGEKDQKSISRVKGALNQMQDILKKIQGLKKVEREGYVGGEGMLKLGGGDQEPRAKPEKTPFAETLHLTRMKKVSELMSRELVMASPDEKLSSALKRMAEAKIGMLLVGTLDALVGIFSERDVLTKAIPAMEAGKAAGGQIKDFMTPDPIRVGPGEPYYLVLDLMRTHDIRHLPVVEDGRVVGVVSMRDLMRHYDEELSRQLEEKKAAHDALKSAFESLRDFRTKLSQAGKMVTMGEIGAGVAHEMNQPLNGIAFRIESILMNAKVAEDGELKDKVERIKDQFVRLGSIVSRLGDYAKGRTHRLELMDINVPITDSLYIFKQQFKDHNIDLELFLESDEQARAHVDRYEIMDVVMNFLVNARDAIDEVYKREPGGRIVVVSRVLKEDGAVAVGVFDNGKPVLPGTEKKIFDSFYTTKGPERGTGLGLSLSRTIVLAHNGIIHFTQRENRGKVFYFVLPVRKEQAFGAGDDLLRRVENSIYEIMELKTKPLEIQS
ncbi:MAG: response regulator [Candidatus Omnitrophica bacterium]|nr:response regulator [Candidatus Omnitrophota bacterium]